MTGAYRSSNGTFSLFEQTFNAAAESEPEEEIAALADEIFENNQFVNHHFDDFLSLDGQFGSVPLDSLNEVFFSEISENQPEERYSGSNIQVYSI